MPIYEYKCSSCGYHFDELMASGDSSEKLTCKLCGQKANRQMSSFAPVISGGSSNETVDMKIGREAASRWKFYEDKQSKRHSTGLKEVDVPKSKDGKFMPVMGLGSSQDRKKRSEYSSSLQEHRRIREEKGQSQFSG